MGTALPPGYRFNPTDQELVWHYLNNKVHGKPLPSNAVIDCNIYGGDDSWRKMFEDRQEECLYFFTKLRNLGSNNLGSTSTSKARRGKTIKTSRAGRATKFGTWKCQNDVKIFSGRKHIGTKRIFSFIDKNDPKTKRSNSKAKRANGWTMHEYRLDGCLLNQLNEAGTSDYGYVLSRIKRPKHMISQVSGPIFDVGCDGDKASVGSCVNNSGEAISSYEVATDMDVPSILPVMSRENEPMVTDNVCDGDEALVLSFLNTIVEATSPEEVAIAMKSLPPPPSISPVMPSDSEWEQSLEEICVEDYFNVEEFLEKLEDFSC